jgi:hypothetical protein
MPGSGGGGATFRSTISEGDSFELSAVSSTADEALRTTNARITTQVTAINAVAHAYRLFGFARNLFRAATEVLVELVMNVGGSALKSVQLRFSSFFRNASWIQSLLTSSPLSIIVGSYS